MNAKAEGVRTQRPLALKRTARTGARHEPGDRPRLGLPYAGGRSLSSSGGVATDFWIPSDLDDLPWGRRFALFPFGRAPLPTLMAQDGQPASMTVREPMRARQTWVRKRGHCHQASSWEP